MNQAVVPADDVGEMVVSIESMRTEGSPEQSLRRVLKAAGYRMRKSRAPISSDNLGGYMIVDMSGNAVAAGGRFELTLEEVREWVRDMC